MHVVSVGNNQNMLKETTVDGKQWSILSVKHQQDFGQV